MSSYYSKAGELQLTRLIRLCLNCLTCSLDEFIETVFVQAVGCVTVALQKQGLFREVSWESPQLEVGIFLSQDQHILAFPGKLAYSRTDRFAC